MSKPIGNIEELPFAWFYEDDDIKWCSFDKNHLPNDAIPLYTHPMRQLTDEEIMIIHDATNTNNWVIDFARAIIKASRGEK